MARGAAKASPKKAGATKTTTKRGKAAKVCRVFCCLHVEDAVYEYSLLGAISASSKVTGKLEERL